MGYNPHLLSQAKTGDVPSLVAVYRKAIRANDADMQEWCISRAEMLNARAYADVLRLSQAGLLNAVESISFQSFMDTVWEAVPLQHRQEFQHGESVPVLLEAIAYACVKSQEVLLRHLRGGDSIVLKGSEEE